jgi:7-cyano-7-deazaguanine synthase
LHAWGFGCGECPACRLRKRGYEAYLAGEKVTEPV